MEIPEIPSRRQSIVVITGYRSIGDEVSEVVQEALIDHSPTTPDAVILGEAFRRVHAAGGLMNDGPDDSINFYPVQSLSKVSFSVKKVQLADSFAMPH